MKTELLLRIIESQEKIACGRRMPEREKITKWQEKFYSPINLCYCERIISLDGKEVGLNGNEEGSEEAGEKSRQEEVIFGGAVATPPLLTSHARESPWREEGSVRKIPPSSGQTSLTRSLPR
jgi:hypothetical protein